MNKTKGILIEKIPLLKLEPGQILTFNLLDEKGQILLGKGKQVTQSFLTKLRSRGQEYVFAEVLKEVEIKTASEDISLETKRETLSHLEETFAELSKGRKTSLQPLEQDVQKIVQEVHSHQELIIPIIQLKRHDDATFTHSLNVAIITTFIGKFLGLDEEQSKILSLGALLHDVGKLLIPPEILNKPQSLNPKEWEIIQKHPLTAQQIFENTKQNLSKETKNVILQHHEKLDGSGYPFHLEKKTISPFAQIVAVADIYEALTSKRPYRQALPIFEVVEYLMGNAGYKLDEKVLSVFVNHISPYQVGDVVQLSSGEEAMVSRLNPILPFRPFVRIRKYLPDGTVILSEEIDLSQSLVLTIVKEIELKSQIQIP